MPSAFLVFLINPLFFYFIVFHIIIIGYNAPISTYINNSFILIEHTNPTAANFNTACKVSEFKIFSGLNTEKYRKIRNLIAW